MKNLIHIFILLFAVAACSKKNDSDSNAGNTPVLKDFSGCKVVSWADEEVTWDSQGRVKTLGEYTYSYFGNLVTITDRGMPFATLYLNKNNFPDSGTYLIYTQGGAIPAKVVCKYDAQNYLTSYSFESMGYVINVSCFYANGNKIKEEYTDEDGTFGINYSYNQLSDSRKSFFEKVYFLKHHNTVLLNAPMLFGRASNNQLVSFTVDSDGPTMIRYELDTDEKIIKEFHKEWPRPDEFSFGIEYNCK